MPDPAIQLLCDLLAAGPGPFRAEAVGDPLTIARLQASDVLVETGSSPTAWCTECDGGHLAAVIRDEEGRQGWVCPQNGFVEAEPKQLRQLSLDTDRLVRGLSTICGARTARQPAAPDGIRIIGTCTSEGPRTGLLLASRLDEAAAIEPLRELVRRLPLADITLVLVADQALSVPISANPLIASWPLADLLTIDETDGIALDPDRLADAARHLLPKPPKARPGRPSGIDATRSAVEKLRSLGRCPTGRNAAADAVYNSWMELDPGIPRPALSTLREHLTILLRECS